MWVKRQGFYYCVSLYSAVFLRKTHKSGHTCPIAVYAGYLICCTKLGLLIFSQQDNCFLQAVSVDKQGIL